MTSSKAIIINPPSDNRRSLANASMHHQSPNLINANMLANMIEMKPLNYIINKIKLLNYESKNSVNNWMVDL